LTLLPRRLKISPFSGMIASADRVRLRHVRSVLGIAVPMVALPVIHLRVGIDPYHSSCRGLRGSDGLRRWALRPVRSRGSRVDGRRISARSGNVRKGFAVTADGNERPDIFHFLGADTGFHQIVNRTVGTMVNDLFDRGWAYAGKCIEFLPGGGV